MTPVILSIQVGKVRSFFASNPKAQSWASAIVKEAVSGPIRLGFEGLDGDEHADSVHHGGCERAALVYASSHYHSWRGEIGRPDLTYGAFGENLTIAGATEAETCIGDIYRIGDAVVQVSQPRQPCWKLERLHKVEGLAQLAARKGRTGWYLRVLAEGVIEPGQRLALLERPYPDLTVALANAVMYKQNDDKGCLIRLASCPALSPDWRHRLSKRLKEGG
ncbi:hypothetical protein PYK22_01976 [Pyrinomonas methylaliphatogenes]|jgi:MOSC domain-containing protein YiiM|uniref:MOSC domain-containing protein n=1 Tax=Pyrinomonas methylaliphatogenes TaxID=454194 RepID=A0A0B6WZ15_9BACT|nr:hypothetical protein PYK22_01976 [Pyrinomonas methylaliphatogenes]